MSYLNFRPLYRKTHIPKYAPVFIYCGCHFVSCEPCDVGLLLPLTLLDIHTSGASANHIVFDVFGCSIC